jgi:thiol-disulfide isomerase/thioredoxin
MRLILITAALVGLAACQQKATQQPPSNESAPAAEAGPQKGVDRSHKGVLFPTVTISDPYGKPTDLRQPFRDGFPVLLNLWATWCAPCVKELPTLNRLKDQVGTIAVVAVSQDDGPQASVAAFLTKLRVFNLQPYHDPKMALSAALGPDTVLPTTILYDANGKEVWRYVGDLDWTSPEAAKLLSEAGAARGQ